MNISEWTNITQIILALLGSSGILYTVFKLGKKYIISPFINHFKLVADSLNKINIVSNQLDTMVLPIIKSLSTEFSINSGKSIKDQITRIDNAVRLAELRSKLIASSFSNIGMYECDPQGKCIWANSALCDLFGLPHEEVLGNGWLSGVMDDEREDVLEKWLTSIEHNIPYDTTYTVRNNKTHEVFKVKTSAMSNKSVDGKILGYYGQMVRL